MMKFKHELQRILKNDMPAGKLRLLPSGYQRIGDIIIINIKPELKEFQNTMGESILNLIPKAKTVCVKQGISGELRTPMTRKVAGDGTETVHIEDGCRYMLDVTKVMFAKGNSSERGRLAKLVAPGEVIVDMFAGIGYFSIPMAVHAKPEKIIAIEKNPDAVHYLRENIRLNKASTIEVIEGDNRHVMLTSIADRVVMGYLPGTEKFLPHAFNFLKEKGVIHFHNTYRKEGLWEAPINHLEKAAEESGFRLEKVMRKAIVKHYSPGVEHVVIDASFKRS